MERQIIDHTHPAYIEKRGRLSRSNGWNGAYYYSQEIVKNIIPAVKTDRSWVTVNVEGVGTDHAVVFVHNNLHPEHYDWLNQYDDLVLICGIPETVEKVAHLGKAVYLPLSVDVGYVEKFRAPEHERELNRAFVGRPSKRKGVKFPRGTVILEGMPRDQLLRKMAKCHDVYAVGRTAIEAKVLGCEILPYDPRFPDPERWKIVDNAEAAATLQRLLNEIDGAAKWTKPNGKEK